MTDRLMIAYGLMLLMVVAGAAATWWNIHHSHRRTYQGRMAPGRKKVMAAEQAGREPVPGSEPA